MKISLNYSELLFDISNKNRSEVSLLEPALRYRAEIGKDKEDEVQRCLISSLSTLTSKYMRFIPSAGFTFANNELSIPESIEIDLCGSERRFSGKLSAIASCMHSILVSMTLSKFYLSVGQADLSTMRDNVATSDFLTLKKLLYSKIPPCLC